MAALSARGAVDGVESTGFVRLVKAREPLDICKRMGICAALRRKGKYGADLGNTKT